MFSHPLKQRVLSFGKPQSLPIFLNSLQLYNKIYWRLGHTPWRFGQIPPWNMHLSNVFNYVVISPSTLLNGACSMDTWLPLKLRECSSFEVSILSHIWLCSSVSTESTVQRNQSSISTLGNPLSSNIPTELTIQRNRVSISTLGNSICSNIPTESIVQSIQVSISILGNLKARKSSSSWVKQAKVVAFPTSDPLLIPYIPSWRVLQYYLLEILLTSSRHVPLYQEPLMCHLGRQFPHMATIFKI